MVNPRDIAGERKKKKQKKKKKGTDLLGQSHRLVGLVVMASASRAEDPRFDFFGVESYQ